MNFEVRLEWEIITEQKETLIVRGQHLRYQPMRKHGHPDLRSEADDGAIEDIEIMDKDGVLLPIKIQDALLSDESFLEAISRRLE